MNKHTKIVCTIGPATESQKSLENLLNAGMNVMRLNFSHGDFVEHQGRVDNVRKASKKTGRPIAILQDLGGPKIRIGMFKTDSVNLKPGQTFTLTTDKIEGDETRVSVNYPRMPKEVAKGHIIYLHDGRKKLEVLNVKGNDIVCKVIVGGDIKGKRGVNLPDSDLSISSMTDKDRSDLEFGLKNDVDFIALSFVRRPEDITELRNILNRRKSKAKIIAKIETPQALKNIDEIMILTDGIMVARGDLAIEIPAEQVPLAQKMLIRKCNELGKPVITATQMLESMIKSPVPTRAEVSDVANAILDGTDAIMLSEETTLGEFPVEAVTMMSKIAQEVENDFTYRQRFSIPEHSLNQKIGESVTASAIRTADRVDARIIVSLTRSGYSARMMSSHKPHQPIIVFTPDPKTYAQTYLSYGTYPIMIKEIKHIDDALKTIRTILSKDKAMKKGDKYVVATAIPFGGTGETNALVVETL